MINLAVNNPIILIQTKEDRDNPENQYQDLQDLWINRIFNNARL